jgi:hypothetical protein
MTERFGKRQKDSPIKSAKDEDESQIFGSNSAYSGANQVLNDRKIWTREKDSPIKSANDKNARIPLIKMGV